MARKKISLIGNLGAAMAKLNDVSFNASGTVGTEPTATRNKAGGFDYGTQVKLGRLGSFTIPRRKKK